ncbi:asparagine synthase (glutamine-hydrolyzing) [Thermomonospora umbrina]|uniref:asparagine synthase (glutamine-hydrolyzing) n=1 Tax=Thermomonospora umbrina TaxID=111806 RepID=A0A3D9SK14_9ACTN|nr:asparagine synthase (glutamine-hydrolyzing) [Thermomonospora umbrina]REE96256.1 asparagine synthase (glutamine-hydrolysing) [Thermomonospora umbrina]
MCGITGWAAFRRDLDTAEAQGLLDAMTETMACRGPDERGTWRDRHVAIGHRRLAVIDLPGGKQPMRADTPDGPVVLTYSGEVYNYVELRAELDRRGHRFRTSSDTEVVLRGYLEWGDAVAERLTGMYAFALWDGRTERLVLIRDRMGVKPLYHHPTEDGVLFGSEPKAILAHPLVRKAVDLDGLRELFSGTKAHGQAVWRGMREVRPGTVVTVTADGLRERVYWRLRPTEHTDDLNTTVARIRHLLTDAVDHQLVSDVPRCVLLSGGLDSSAITGLAAARLAADGRRVRTFSVDFAGQEENFRADGTRETPDAPFVREVAALVDSEHTDIVLDQAALADPALRRATVAARDLPLGFGDLDASLYLLFAALREHSTVALSGESADEVFGGYRWFHDREARDSGTFPWLHQYGLNPGRSFLDPGLDAELALPEYVADEYSRALREVEHLDGTDADERLMRSLSHMHLTRFVRMLLDRKDRMSMAVGLEVRVPFCDHRLVEYVYNTPWSLKTFDGREKSLLREATRHVIPRSVAERRKSPYPSIQDPRYTATLQQQAKEILADRQDPVFTLVGHDWLLDRVNTDPAEVGQLERVFLERALDLHTWLDLHRPELP